MLPNYHRDDIHKAPLQACSQKPSHRRTTSAADMLNTVIVYVVRYFIISDKMQHYHFARS
jgi:hypothetical protein